MTMRLLANENFPVDAILALREKGHDVVWISEIARGISDSDVLARAHQEGRILVTFDKDFGELAFRTASPEIAGIILFRISMRSPQHVAALASRVISSREDWAGHFSVVEDARLRMTPLRSRPQVSNSSV